MGDVVNINERELTADDIFGAEDLIDVLKVEIPEWKKDGKPGVLYVRPMSAAAAIRFRESLAGSSGKNVFVRILAECACDRNGNLLFSLSDIERLKSPDDE